jgi:uracil-DNA glycosylase family 4
VAPRRFRGQKYWAKPLPSFGDAAARVLIVGLAPAAHGGNRTGRIFTGDASGDFLFQALHRTGFASAPRSVSRDDGLKVGGALITAAVRCAPPQNRPSREELDTCRPFLIREVAALKKLRVLVALGGVAFEACLKALKAAGVEIPKPRPRFSHGAEFRLGRYVLLGSYHPSQQNTFTGKLTLPMIVAVFARARRLAR